MRLSRIDRHYYFVIPAKAGIQRWRGGSRRDRLLTWDRLKHSRVQHVAAGGCTVNSGLPAR